MVANANLKLGPEAQFQQFLNQGLFRVQKNDNGKHVFYPRVLTPGTGEVDLQWVEPSGHAEIYSISRIPRKADRGGDYFVAIVELEEGPRMMTQLRLNRDILSESHTPKIGDAVRAVVICKEGEDARLYFEHGVAGV